MTLEKPVTSIPTVSQSESASADGELKRILNATDCTAFTSRAENGRMQVGTLRQCDSNGKGWLVEIADTTIPATLAASCLMRPQLGDLVQVFVLGSNCWLMAVLERCDPSSELVIDTGDAPLRICSQKLHIVASDELALRSRSYSNRTEVIIQAAAERQTYIRGTDATRAGTSLQYVERHLGMHAKNVVVTGSALLKMDAAQMHMG